MRMRLRVNLLMILNVVTRSSHRPCSVVWVLIIHQFSIAYCLNHFKSQKFFEFGDDAFFHIRSHPLVMFGIWDRWILVKTVNFFRFSRWNWLFLFNRGRLFRWLIWLWLVGHFIQNNRFQVRGLTSIFYHKRWWLVYDGHHGEAVIWRYNLFFLWLVDNGGKFGGTGLLSHWLFYRFQWD